MSGVDRSDQLLFYYPCEKKTLQWNKKIIIHIFQMMLLLNTHNLYNKYETKLPLWDFRLSVITASSSAPSELPCSKPSSKMAVSECSQDTKSDECEAIIRLRRKNWSASYRMQLNKTTPYFCRRCPDKPGLCIDKCFET